MSVTNLSPIEYFRIKTDQSPSKSSQGNLNRAIDSFTAFFGGTDISFDNFHQSLLAEWVAHQLFEGYFIKTVAYNISKFSALYNKAVAEGLAQPTDSFSVILRILKELPSDSDDITHSANFRKIRDIFVMDYSRQFEKQLAKDIILFGLLNGGLSLSEIVGYKKDEYTGSNPEILRIVNRYSKPKNKYLFPLHQSRTTVKKIIGSVETLIANILYPSGEKPYAGDPDFMLLQLWCDIAFNSGVSASDIKSCISSKGCPNVLTACALPSEIDSEKIAQIREKVTDIITSNPVHWYAMHLRNRLEYKDLTDRLKEKKITLDEMYYPMEDIIRKVGKKKIFENRPVISWLVFYKARESQLKDLFTQIGDIAWGYRYIRDVRSPYAIISNNDIAGYQLAIGTLSPSTVLSSDNDIKIQKGDRLVILGGPMVGLQGTLISEKKEKGDSSGRIVYRISLTGGNNINWEVTCDPHLVKKI